MTGAGVIVEDGSALRLHRLEDCGRTLVRSNGSKWAGEAPDPVRDLLERLRSEVLTRAYNAEETMPNGAARFTGNFLHVAAVFDVETTDPATIAALRDAMAENRLSSAYLVQDTPEQEAAKVKKHWAEWARTGRYPARGRR